MERIERLTSEVQSARDEVAGLRAALSGHTTAMRRRMQWLLSALVVVAALSGIAAWQLHTEVKAARRVAEDQRKLCPLVQLLIPGPGDTQPATKRGIESVKAAREYAAAINCPGA